MPTPTNNFELFVHGVHNGSTDTYDDVNSQSWDPAYFLGIPGGTLAMTGSPANWTISATANDALRISNTVSFSSADAYNTAVFPSVQASPRYLNWQFGNGLFDPTGNAEDVARLYQAVFGRQPDAGDLYGYANQVDQGTISLAQVANFLISSPEFLAKHPAAVGTSASAQAMFVNQLYENLFDRPADAGGGYVTALQNGESEGQIALDMSRSLETLNDYLPDEGDRSLSVLARLYIAAFGSTPDPIGEADYIPLLNQGESASAIASFLLSSPEFARTAGAGSNTAFVTQTYENLFGRTPDAGGLAGYTAALTTGGFSRAQVLADLSNSTEARADTASTTHDAWVLLQS